MIINPNCKINLGLNVVRKRIDGFHDLETIFYPLDLHDTIDIVIAADGIFRFSASGIKIPGDQSANLCVQAFELMKEHFNIPSVEIHLKKSIPMGSGLGGGSSDGAYTLKALNHLFHLDLKTDQMKAFASRLGSDCTFFIESIPSFARGRGEVLEAVKVNLSGFYLLVVVPPVHVSTAEAYAMIQPSAPKASVRQIVNLPIDQWKGRLINDFEGAVCRKFPVIGQIRELLYQRGAVYASMSGSGSAVYGLFNEIPAVESLFPGCFVWLSARI